MRHVCVSCTDIVKDLRVQLGSKLRFHSCLNCIFYESLGTFGLITTLIYFFSTFDCLLILYLTLARLKLEYAFVVWNSDTSADGRKLERIQALSSFFYAVVTYEDFLI